MDLEEERRLVEAVLHKNHVIGCYVGVLGETALRMTEGLLLKWKFVNLGERTLTVEASKNYKTRYVPLSDYAIELLRSIPRVIGCEYVFAKASTKDRWRDPRGPFYAGRKAAGMEWVGFHDFRHFRATQWVKGGIDLRTVQELLGHRDITTTMRYYARIPYMCSKAIELVDCTAMHIGLTQHNIRLSFGGSRFRVVTRGVLPKL
jgi:integrase